jgi:hypothetical protein
MHWWHEVYNAELGGEFKRNRFGSQASWRGWKLAYEALTLHLALSSVLGDGLA